MPSAGYCRLAFTVTSCTDGFAVFLSHCRAWNEHQFFSHQSFFLALAQLVKCCIHNSGVVEQVVVLLCLPLKRWEQQIVQLIGCILPADRLHLTWLFILNPVVCPCTLINMNTHHPGGYDVHTIPHLLLVVFTWLATAMCVDHVNCISIFSRLTFVFLHHHLLNLCQDDFCFVDTACKD